MASAPCLVRNLLVPCDGTWNGKPTHTNVRRLAELLSALNPPDTIVNVLPPGGFFEGVGFGRTAVRSSALWRPIQRPLPLRMRIMCTYSNVGG